MSWYRLIDRAHPLWGLEVCGRLVLGNLYRRGTDLLEDEENFEAIEVTAVRRLDVFVGDKVLQVPEVRGMYLSCKLLERSPVQEDVELSFDSPYGKCLVESSRLVEDGRVTFIELNYVIYEQAVTVVLLRKYRAGNRDNDVLASETFRGRYVEQSVIDAYRSFCRGSTSPVEALRDAIIDGSFFAKRGGD